MTKAERVARFLRDSVLAENSGVYARPVKAALSRILFQLPEPAFTKIENGVTLLCPHPRERACHYRGGGSGDTIVLHPGALALGEAPMTGLLAHELGHCFERTEEGVNRLVATWGFAQELIMLASARGG